MRWILCGKNTAASRCLELLVARGDEAWAIGTAGDDGRDGWQRSFRAAAERLGVPFDQPRRINAPAVVERLAAFDAHALVSIQYDQILKGSLLRAIGRPCLNLHFALLPRHRGVAPIAWAVAAGDAEAGVTLHHMVEDIDAGDVIAQRAVPIGPADTAREVYDAVSAATVDLFRECYPFPPALLAARRPQDPQGASYHRGGEFDFSRRTVDWSRPALDLQRWLRAMIFPPLQHPETAWRGRRRLVTRVGGVLGPAVAAPPGSVVGRSSEGLEVAAGGGTLRVRGLRDPERPGDGERAIETVAVGDRFG